MQGGQGRSFELREREVGSFGNNAYVLVDNATRQSVVIDPAAEAAAIRKMTEGTTVKLILLTHGHGDHVQALREVRKATGAPVGIHPADAPMISVPVDVELSDGQTITFGESSLKVLHTPGHTPGSVCFLANGHLIAGDTLFPGGPGKTGSQRAFRQIVESIESKIYTLPDETAIHPGHGAGTSVGASKEEFSVFKARWRGRELYGDVLWHSA